MKTILIADDEEVNLLLLKHFLKKADYRILTAENGTDALQLLRLYPSIDLVVTDICMPQMDGFSLLQAIRSSKGLEDLPVFSYSSGHEQKKELDFPYQFDYSFKKPREIHLLLHKIGKVLHPNPISSSL
ncbi:response regulator [Echinicola marina]|uniref:response regulator n=1 Tax=Echinicola marina TaxID=2859768 RepID=UPI001CF64D6C|nr:response regulator [Echinicola marina]UCS93992.1 response regulator [Echinicola marina]